MLIACISSRRIRSFCKQPTRCSRFFIFLHFHHLGYSSICKWIYIAGDCMHVRWIGAFVKSRLDRGNHSVGTKITATRSVTPRRYWIFFIAPFACIRSDGSIGGVSRKLVRNRYQSAHITFTHNQPVPNQHFISVKRVSTGAYTLLPSSVAQPTQMYSA